MRCDDCDAGNHGVADIRANGSVVCACCRTTIAPYVMDDQRPMGHRFSYMEALKLNKLHLFSAFSWEA